MLNECKLACLAGVSFAGAVSSDVSVSCEPSVQDQPARACTDMRVLDWWVLAAKPNYLHRRYLDGEIDCSMASGDDAASRIELFGRNPPFGQFGARTVVTFELFCRFRHWCQVLRGVVQSVGWPLRDGDQVYRCDNVWEAPAQATIPQKPTRFFYFSWEFQRVGCGHGHEQVGWERTVRVWSLP